MKNVCYYSVHLSTSRIYENKPWLHVTEIVMFTLEMKIKVQHIREVQSVLSC